jgi:hypothetical protein
MLDNRKSEGLVCGTVYEVAAGPRYEMCGNGWASDVAAWVGARVMLVENLLRKGLQHE